MGHILELIDDLLIASLVLLDIRSIVGIKGKARIVVGIVTSHQGAQASSSRIEKIGSDRGIKRHEIIGFGYQRSRREARTSLHEPQRMIGWL